LKSLGPITVFLLGILPAAIAYAAMLGLGLHRHAPAWVISLSATILVFGPPLVAAALAWRGRIAVFGALVGVWGVAILSAMPVYFPGERRDAVATGMSLVNAGPSWESVANAVADTLPVEPVLAVPEVPEAMPLVEAPIPIGAPLGDDEIALHYDGAGRRLSVDVGFVHQGKTVHATMMLDTGATYTTLPLATLAELGVVPSPDDPTIVLHTANGEREAQVVLLDAVDLGGLRIEGVAVATCEACASPDTDGLLGLNITGNFNLTIDADRREIVFAARNDENRRLDVTPFTDLAASLSRYPGGRMEVEVRLKNIGPRPVIGASAEIRCDAQSWSVDLDRVAPGAVTVARRRLPDHAPCERYQVALQSAVW
jgi:clan AA aspartic protease (TIGR02281 family)